VLLESVAVHFSIAKCPRAPAKVIADEAIKRSMQLQHSGPFGYAGSVGRTVESLDVKLRTDRSLGALLG
jgi:hypothetical protein